MNKFTSKKTKYALVLLLILISALFLISFYFPVDAAAPNQPVAPAMPRLLVNLDKTNNVNDLSESVQLLVIFTILSLLPSMLIMMTSFTRIVVILSFLKQAIGAQQSIPSQLMIGLSIFLTLFIMSPTLETGYNSGIKPYIDNKITQQQAIVEFMKPVRKFMFKQTRESDVKLFVELSKDKKLQSEQIRLDTIPNKVLIPSFIISELKTAFQVGFLLYVPFVIIDMVVSSTLMSMGMMMLPPMMISMPFKILLFVLVDGWDLVVKSIVLGFK